MEGKERDAHGRELPRWTVQELDGVPGVVSARPSCGKVLTERCKGAGGIGVGSIQSSAVCKRDGTVWSSSYHGFCFVWRKGQYLGSRVVCKRKWRYGSAGVSFPLGSLCLWEILENDGGMIITKKKSMKFSCWCLNVTGRLVALMIMRNSCLMSHSSHSAIDSDYKRTSIGMTQRSQRAKCSWIFGI